ncbi:NADH dehydrogenase FAD-containing subunit [Paraburkholderia sp. BL6669N2]|uniref:NAD(P)/FAD-dependent oxidoreductase n=1 Tax=Paraburkholderia sp. BL6669N2 TaxID=1938807 RepID=UPI000E23C925|nr:FAD-dependent oxidoreductase [Paraburkholderia sp. BL6669N2]REG51651.1 NADH dehydrogenase FAD-containing subunit [Paraburkholderia sp. BL6669N2]
MKRIVVIGAGFAGLWSAVGAARKLDELRVPADEVEVVVINGTPYHSIRVRNYEQNLDETRVPLADVLGPIGVQLVEGSVSGIDSADGRITVQTRGLTQTLVYDRLVIAAGSQLVHPDIPGLTEHTFDVDTFSGATKLAAHLRGLPALASAASPFTAVVVGAGLTGIELAAELPARLRGIAGDAHRDAVHVVLADRSAKIGQAMGGAQPVIERAMNALGVEMLAGVSLQSVDADGVELTNGTRIEAATVVWCGGMRANALTAQIPVTLDPFGRLPVDAFMRVENVPQVFAAGDCARVLIDGARPSVMSCQHGRPMGRYAGHNVVCDLLGGEMLPLHIDWYTTILDLGPWGAVYTEGWDRHLVSEGDAAKATKQTINCIRIYPPRTGVRDDILQAAAPVVQTPPPTIAAR